MAEALISKLLEQLASLLFEQTKQAVTLILNAEEDVDRFCKSLKVIQAVLEDAEKKQVTKPTVREWLQQLKDVSYEMEDILDEWNSALLRQQMGECDNALVTKKKVCLPNLASCFCFGQINKVIHYHNIARRLKELNKKLDVIVAERSRHSFLLSTIPSIAEEPIKHQKTSSLVDISTIFGREEEKEVLLSKLLRDDNQDEESFIIIPIVGMGGIGKTTLAQLAYNDTSVKTHFDVKVWVCVSDPFDEIKVAKAITENLMGTQNSSNELETLILCIKSRVEGNKFLLVLDDVWTEDKTVWDNLKLPIIFQSCAKGSTILVTTRKERVARMMRATSSVIHMDKLSDRNCIALFNSIAFLDREEDEANGFGAIGEKIVKKCKGLPLVAKTLGGLVWNKKTLREWRDVLNNEIWDLEEVEDQVFRPLLLSYYDLAPKVKCCLLYCAIFPKDTVLYKRKLIALWMSQDYLYSGNDNQERKNGENYFESLTMRSFFQDIERDDRGNIYQCKMHDIMHDFVQFLTKSECFITETGETNDLEQDNVRHLTLWRLLEGPLQIGYKNIRTLVISHSKISSISPDTILQIKCLRTLDLSDNMLSEIPKEIGELLHLRYLNLSTNYNLQEVPDAVCDLCNLQTLDLGHCFRLETLPKGMGKLINLKHLHIWGCNSLRYLPKGISNLKSLQVLDCFFGSDDSVNDEEALKLGDLGMMDQLQGKLRIKRLGTSTHDNANEMRKAQLWNKDYSELKLWFEDWGNEEGRTVGDPEIVKAMQPHQNLDYLFIQNCQASTMECLSWIDSLHNLRKLWLWDWRYCQVLSPLGKFQSLEILKIWGMENVKKVGADFLGRKEEEEDTARKTLFPKLKELYFHDMPNWEEWEGISNVSYEITIMPRLSELRIIDCPKLRELPDFLNKLTSLSAIEIADCPILAEEVAQQFSHIPNLIIR